MAVIHYRGGSRFDAGEAARLKRRGSSERTALRIYAFALVALLWLVAAMIRMGDMQIRQASRFTEKALKQQEGIVQVGASRGAIYDRFGEELALSTPVDSIGVFPDKIKDAETTAAMLSEILDIDRKVLLRKLQGPTFVWVKRFAEPGEAERVRHLNLPGIHFEKESKRYYPKGTVAAHVLGSVGVDHDGLAGLEQTFETRLRGTPGKNLVQYDALRNHYASRILDEPIPGSDLILTLDQRIQMLAERELRTCILSTQAQAGTIVVMDPRKGDVLAMANWPTFDPHAQPHSQEDLDRWRNYAISDLIEPGSTFKIVTLSAAIEEGLTYPEEQIFCENGHFSLGRRIIHDYKSFGTLTVAEVLANSSNIGAVKIAQRLREPRFYEYIRRYGFGERTGISLPNELEGMLWPLDRWRATSLASIAFGHEIGVTALQMARATAVIANGGLLVKPRLVDAIVDPSGHREQVEIEPARRILTSQTAATLRAMMEKTVLTGTGRLAKVDGYRVAGKTGTAQKVDRSIGTYSAHDYIANFVGFTPVNDPSLVVVIVIDSPHGEHHGGSIAAPVFPHLAAQALRFRDVPPELPIDPRKKSKPAPETLAEYVNEPWTDQMEGTPRSSDGALLVSAMDSSRDAVFQTADVRESEPAPASQEKIALRVTGRVMPDFHGRAMREVVAEAASLGLQLDARGRGVAVKQSPPAGSPIAEDTTIHVAFGRVAQEVRQGP